jgi:redox-sensitive bicupin YhaK (pirin superfamily)
MMAPRYREVKGHQIPQIVIDQGVHVRIISGAVQGTRGPVQDIITEPEYLDVTIPAGAEFIHATPVGNTVAAYVIEGKAYFCHETPPSADEVARAKDCDPQREAFMTDGSLVLFNPGGQIVVSTEDTPARFLLLSGKPIGEPVAWHGPIVMNTRDELQVAFDEYREGTFIKHREV